VVRHPLPLALFRLFVEPFASQIVVEDGETSFRRSYTAGELHQITATALAGSAATFRQFVGPFYLRQVIDISYYSPTLVRSENPVSCLSPPFPDRTEAAQ
jgi:hypothetical protein